MPISLSKTLFLIDYLQFYLGQMEGPIDGGVERTRHPSLIRERIWMCLPSICKKTIWVPEKDLKYLPQQGDNDHHFSRECSTPENCVSVSPPGMNEDVGDAALPSINDAHPAQ